MSETVNCKDCGALTWATDVPSKKSGFCWRCEVKRLNAVTKRLDQENDHLRENLAIMSRELERYKSALFKTIYRLRVILFYFSSTKVETAVAIWLNWTDNGIDLLNPPPDVDKLLGQLEPPGKSEIL